MPIDDPTPGVLGGQNDGPRDWGKLYEETPVESMPWFNPNIDDDLDKELRERKINKGSFLDLGTGPGTQAIHLATRGFKVTGSDVSSAAVEKAKKREGGNKVRFVQDDILDSKLEETFDYIFDRGCFHVFRPEDHARYLTSVEKLIKPGGLVFLKCFSVKEPEGFGPRRFSEQELRKIFGSLFTILSIRDTIFQGSLHPDSGRGHPPAALFTVMRR